MGGQESTPVNVIGTSHGVDAPHRIEMTSLYRKNSIFSIFSDGLPEAPYPTNTIFRQRISETEWRDFASHLKRSLQDNEPPDVLMCAVLVALAVMSYFLQYGFIVLIIALCAAPWYHSFKRMCWINTIYSILANYNKYLFRPRGTQLRLQVKCGDRPITTGSVRVSDMSFKLEIADAASRAALALQFSEIRTQSRRTLRHKSVNSSAENYMDFYEKHASVFCLPAVNASLDESKVRC